MTDIDQKICESCRKGDHDNCDNFGKDGTNEPDIEWCECDCPFEDSEIYDSDVVKVPMRQRVALAVRAFMVWLLPVFVWRLWNRFIWLKREWASRWYCWRNGMVPVGRCFRLMSLRVGMSEQMVGEVPAEMFYPAAWGPLIVLPAVEAGVVVSLVVKNVSNKPAPFRGVFMLRAFLDGYPSREAMMVCPLPSVVVPAGFEQTLEVRPTKAGIIERLCIPEYTNKQ